MRRCPIVTPFDAEDGYFDRVYEIADMTGEVTLSSEQSLIFSPYSVIRGYLEVPMHRIVIVGGGTGGTLSANRLRKIFGPDEADPVIDQDDQHVYQPGLLSCPSADARPADIVRPRATRCTRESNIVGSR